MCSVVEGDDVLYKFSIILHKWAGNGWIDRIVKEGNIKDVDLSKECYNVIVGSMKKKDAKKVRSLMGVEKIKCIG